MGYYGTYVCWQRPHLTQSLKNHFKKEYSGETDTHTSQVEYVSVKFGTAYLAIRRTEKSTGAFDIYAMVIKYQLSKYNGIVNEILERPIDEGGHPYYYAAPKKLLKMLTEPMNEWALEWRLNVAENYVWKDDEKPTWLREA